MSSTAGSPLGDSDHGWIEIEHSLAEIADLSQSDISFGEYAKVVLDRTTGLLAAAGGAVWVVGSSSELNLQAQINLELLGADDAEASITGAHASFLHRVSKSGDAMVVPPRSTARGVGVRDNSGVRGNSGNRGEQANPSDYLWIGSAFRLDGNVVGVVEVLQRPEINAATQQGNLRLLEMVCDLAGSFLARQQLVELRQSEDRWRQYEDLVSRVHANLDLSALAFQLVNDGRTFIGCDRVTLIVPRRGHLQVIAISGVDTFDRRSALLRSLESLAKVVAQSGQSLRYGGDTEQLAPQLEQPLSAYLDLSHARTIDLIGLRPRSSATPLSVSELVGVLVIEQFESVSDTASDVRVSRVANLGGFALRNSLDYDTLPFLSAARFARRANRFGHSQRTKLVIAASVLLGLVLALVLIPAPFYVKAEGELQPGVRRDIYAPHDGEVVEVLRQHDDRVDAGDVLLVLRSRPLEIELQRLQGEYQTTEKKLLAVGAARVQSDTDSGAANRYPGQLAAEELELKQQQLSLEKQISLVRQQRVGLSVCSPIQGRVLTWNPRELLEDRPVQRGQLLMSTADVDGAWVLELLIPDHRVGYLMTAKGASEEPLEVIYSLATDRGTTYRGQIQKVAGRSEVLDGERASVRVTVTLPGTAVESHASEGSHSPEGRAVELLRPGATIYAKIDCGMKPLGYVWLHDVVEAIKSWLFY